MGTDLERGYVLGRRVEKVYQERKNATALRLLRALADGSAGSEEYEAAFIEARVFLGIDRDVTTGLPVATRGH